MDPNLDILLHKQSFWNLPLINECLSRIKEFDDLFIKLKEFNERIWITNDFYSDDDFTSWLFNINQCSGELREYKLLLQKNINQTQTIEKEHRHIVKEKITRESLEAAYLCITHILENIFFIENLTGWIIINRKRMEKISNTQDFLPYSKRAFLKLYFHPNIEKTLKNLNYDFKQYLPEIIQHLSALEDTFRKIYEEHHLKGLPEVAKIFASVNNLRCSTDAGRSGAKSKMFEFEDEQGHIHNINCELHTKFDSFKHNTDRLYFHQGMKGIQKNKILIAHIGKHL